ncbi:MAG: hypothetical protein HGA70_10540 [Chlorobiaceae bacterium]|nr:hypothetical protein [Chlorobiaceae bacterium]NTW09735.1 hypothetical protein [Chlorobiaceae bacterium]
MSQEKVVLEWGRDKGNEQWFIEILRKNNDGKFSRISDSGCNDFPFNPDHFGPFEEDLLIQKLKEVFPGTEIMLKWC